MIQTGRFFAMSLILFLLPLLADDSCVNSFVDKLLTDGGITNLTQQSDRDRWTSAIVVEQKEKTAINNESVDQLEQVIDTNNKTRSLPRFEYERSAMLLAQGESDTAAKSKSAATGKLQASEEWPPRDGPDGNALLIHDEWQYVWALGQVRDEYSRRKSNVEYKRINKAYCDEVLNYLHSLDVWDGSKHGAANQPKLAYWGLGNSPRTYFSQDGC